MAKRMDFDSLKVGDKIPIVVYDPAAMNNMQQQCIANNNIIYASSMEQVVDASDIIIIATPWPEFNKIGRHIKPDDRKIIIDLWRIIDERSIRLSKSILIKFGKPGVWK